MPHLLVTSPQGCVASTCHWWGSPGSLGQGGAMVRFVRQLAGGRTFLGVSVRVFGEKTSVWIGELCKAGGPPQRGRASANPLRAWIEQKDGRRLSLLSTWLREPGRPSSPALALLVLRPSDSGWNLHQGSPALRPLNNTTGFPGSPTWRWWDLASVITRASSLW